MFCPRCGSAVPNNASLCHQCGTAVRQQPASPPPPPRQVPPRAPVQPLPYAQPHPLNSVAANVPNYLVQAILVTLFCCMPFGVVAIVQASQVTSRLQTGDMHGAMSASRLARGWCWAAFWTGLVIGGLWLLLIAAGSGA